ncbi:hypothetical protein [Nonomuraea endophytica]|uniref:hypothetical protein n=1 Tax=Nonomuraea endophytica TaxID=714136 RepID=UPI0037CC33C4
MPGDVLRIVEVCTDAMGAVSVANGNREFVCFQNVSGAPVDVAGVLVEDNWAQTLALVEGDHVASPAERPAPMPSREACASPTLSCALSIGAS